MTVLTRGFIRHIRPPGQHFSPTSPLDRGLVLECRFDKPTGLLVVDGGPYAAQGSVVSAVTWVSSPYGPGIDVAGNNDGVLFSTSAIYELQDQTFEAVAKMEAGPGAAAVDTIVSKHSAAGGMVWGVRQWGLGTYGLALTYFDGGYQVYEDDQELLSVGTYYHLMGTWTQGTFKSYVSGRLTDTIGTTNNPITHDANEPLQIGYSGGYGDWDGVIAFVRLYNRVFSPAEIQARYQLVMRRTQEIGWIYPASFGNVAAAPPVGAIMNQIQFGNLGADLYNGALI